MSEKVEQVDQVDEGLYSRQLYVYGHASQKLINSSSVLIVGMKGLGIEIAKNVVLAGVHAVGILDDGLTSLSDLGSNFYLKETDVGKVSRAQASFQQLSTLNPYVDIQVVTDEISESLVSKYSVVVVTNQTIPKQIEINQWCRKYNTSFISSDIQGLLLSIFVDNGPSHTIVDADGNQCLRGLISHIENSNPIVITTSDESRHGLSTGDSVTFEDIEGLTSLNDLDPQQIKVISPFSFSIPIDGTSLPQFQGTRGYFNQEKIPFQITNETLENALQSRPFSGDWLCEMIYPHCIYLAVSDFRVQNNRFPSPIDKDEIFQVYNNFGKLLKELGDVDYTEFSDVRKNQYFNLIRSSSASLSPMAAVGGGHVGQEVIKAVSGKFTPIQQFYYFQASEAYPTCASFDNEHLSAEFAPEDSRYHDYIITFGKTLQRKIQDQKLFLVGAGAIGCEMLKNWAMMGVSTSSTGLITVTDMDSIERSNLNRQFLFRSSDVGKLKSVAAGDAACVMNPELKVHSQSLKVAAETESVYDDNFWQSLTGVYTALDNVDARLYVDNRCVYYGKSLVDSGTLGTAGNTQVIVPYVTESYGSTRDPPEAGIPICTLKNFPHKIEHTIQWARDVFEGDFKQGAEEVNNYVKSSNYIAALKQEQNTVLQRVTVLKKRLVDEKPSSFEDCLLWARKRFDHEYNHNIKQLLHQLPVDALTTEGTPFWSGTKRPPTPIEFNPDDQLHLDYVIAAAMLYAFNYNIHGYTDLQRVKDTLNQYCEQPWKPTETKVATTDQEAKEMENNNLTVDLDTEVDTVVKALPTAASLAGLTLQPVEFEKDDDSNFHIAYITACSNLRARNYQIKEESAHMTKFIAGKIIPAIATTTALVTGLVCIEMYKLLDEKKLEDYRSSYVTLATNMFATSEPSPPQSTTTLFPSGFEWKWSLWDKLVIDLGKEPTLGEVIAYLQGEKYGATVTAITLGPALVWIDLSPLEERKAKEALSVRQLAHDTWKQNNMSDEEPPVIGQWLALEVTLENDDGDDLEIPECKIRVSGW